MIRTKYFKIGFGMAAAIVEAAYHAYYTEIRENQVLLN